MEANSSVNQNAAAMALKQKYRRKQYRRTYLREWRKFRGLTLEQLAGRIEATPGSLSLLERGQSAYTQGTLESLAVALGTDAASLLSVDPSKEGTVVDISDILRQAQPADIEAIIGYAQGRLSRQ
jgi:transcriptional regulator with XRE-family HTH domain